MGGPLLTACYWTLKADYAAAASPSGLKALVSLCCLLGCIRCGYPQRDHSILRLLPEDIE